MQLPAACDALTAKLIQQAGFPRVPGGRVCPRLQEGGVEGRGSVHNRT